ncbi:MAG: hypothetical protein F6K42_01195 [Leptolyngbya sp. SIO1D8]|nr:hypothetical protein [Leptolyngbya sp. SIO1D8]
MLVWSILVRLNRLGKTSIQFGGLMGQVRSPTAVPLKSSRANGSLARASR